jgi:hypothetical protein
MKTILEICIWISGLYLLSFIGKLITIVYRLFRKQPVKDEIRYLNPYILFNSFSDKKEGNKYVSTILTIATIVGFLYFTIPYTSFGSREIGSLFEKNDYRTYYYVSMFPGFSEDKNYKETLCPNRGCHCK